MTLHEWMKNKRLTDAQVAERLGGIVTRSQVGRIRTGDSKPTFETATALAKLTAIPVTRFMSGEAGDPSAKRRRQPEAA